MNTLDKPLISVLLPVFNVGHHLTECLESILSQSHENFEIIAIDDFSKDDCWKILKIYKKFDKRLKIYRNVKHYGKAMTLNRCLNRAKGKYLALMDAKDVLYKDRLKKQISYLLDNPKVAAVGTQCVFIDNQNKRIGKSSYPGEYDAIYHQPLHNVSIHFETAMINKYVLPKDLLYFNADADPFLYSDILIKLLQFGPLVNLSMPLQYHRTENPNKVASLRDIPNLIKLWVKSIEGSDYRPSLRSFFLSPFRNTLAQ